MSSKLGHPLHKNDFNGSKTQRIRIRKISPRSLSYFLFFTIFGLVNHILTLLLLVTSPTLATSDPDIPWESEDKEHVDIIVSMKESNSPVLTKLSRRSFPTREERLNSVAQESIRFASKNQEILLHFLSTEGQSRTGTGKVEPKVTSLWITNQVIIQNVDMALIKELSGRLDVDKIELSRSFTIEEPGDDPEAEGNFPDGEDGPWGIANMNVPLVWAKGIRGEGVVVANVDSGVLHTHEALRSNSIGEGGWLDIRDKGHPEPRDKSGHGTATMSLIAGTTKWLQGPNGWFDEKDKKVWEKSARGPPEHDVDLINPDLVAPGDQVQFTNISSDSSCLTISGPGATSLGAPYKAGVVALMLSKNPDLNFKQVKQILLASSVPTVSNGASCGGKPDDEYPNFIARYGRIDVNKAIEYMDTVNKE